MSAWKPLQMPPINPSRPFSSSITPSRMAGLRKKAVMNLPEPSGSSPPEKPPGIKTICACLRLRANASTDSCTSLAERLRTTMVSVSAPAIWKARSVSYSQFVPGNTGMSTRGRAIFTEAFAGVLRSKRKASTFSSPCAARTGNTSSSFAS